MYYTYKQLQKREVRKEMKTIALALALALITAPFVYAILYMSVVVLHAIFS